jgi:hypothetical protein
MINPWFTFGVQAALASEAQLVIGLRIMRLAAGGPRSESEAARVWIMAAGRAEAIIIVGTEAMLLEIRDNPVRSQDLWHVLSRPALDHP